MKRSLKIFTLLLIAAAATLTSCKDDPAEEIAVPKIKLGETEISLAAEGETRSVGYLIENPVEGEKIGVECAADWLTFNTSKVRSIEFSAELNESGAERVAEVTLSYKGAESISLKVTQLWKEIPIKIEIQGVSATEVTFSVITADPELTYIPMVTTLEYYEWAGTPEKVYKDDMDYIAYLAEINDITVEDYLEQMVAKGSLEDIYFENLLPNTEYVLYTYGLTIAGKRTTDIVAVPFTTEKAWEGEITFEFEVEETDHILHYDITPSHTGVPYYYGVIDEPTLNKWKETYGTDDLKTLVQKADIEETFQTIVDYGIFDSIEAYYDLFTETGRVVDGYLACKASTKYIFYACKWDEKCQLIGEISSYEFMTEEAEESVNVLTLTVDNITQSTADATVTTTNDDPYVLIPLKTEAIAGMNDQEIFTYVTANYDVLIGEYTFKGDKTRTYKRMHPNTEYTFLAFGYTAGVLSNNTIVKYPFTTLASGDPKDCTFEFATTPSTESVWVDITPSDMGHFYFWLVCPSNWTTTTFQQYVKDVVIGEWYDGDIAAFSSWRLNQGLVSEDVPGLYPATGYKVGVVIMDYDTGEFLSSVKYSKPFKTKEIVYADINIDVEYDKYFDLQELIDAGMTQYEDMLDRGHALMPIKILLDGDYSAFYINVYGNDVTDEETYPDKLFIDILIDSGSPNELTYFAVRYDYPETIVAIAIDKEGNITHTFRELVNLTAEGASPISEFPLLDSSKGAPLKASVVDWSSLQRMDVGYGNQRPADLYPSEAQSRKALEAVEQMRKEQLRERIAARNCALSQKRTTFARQ